MDSSENAYVTGYTLSSDFPTTVDAYNNSYGVIQDAFVTKFNPAGNGLAYSTYLGGGNHDVGYGIAVDNSGNAYVTGATDSLDFPVVDAYQNSYGGYRDAFVTKFNPAGDARSTSPILAFGL